MLSLLQVFGFLTVIDVGMNGFSIVNLCVMVSQSSQIGETA